MIQFAYLDKAKFPQMSRGLFDILATNMNAIAPTGNAYEDDLASWCGAVAQGLAKENRQIILMLTDGDQLIGFFQYCTSGGLLMMEEIQLASSWQGKDNVFRRLYDFFIPQLSGIQTVEAYANKQNAKSQGILKRLGLTVIGENRTGSSYHYRGQFTALLNWLHHSAR